MALLEAKTNIKFFTPGLLGMIRHHEHYFISLPCAFVLSRSLGGKSPLLKLNQDSSSDHVRSSSTTDVFICVCAGSSITFFAPMSPPSPYGFLVGTAGAATLCAACFNVARSRLLAMGAPTAASAPTVAAGISAGVLLFWYKVMATIYPSCARLPVTMAASVNALELASPFARWHSSGAYPCVYLTAYCSRSACMLAH
jgi:hypothetical protein